MQERMVAFRYKQEFGKGHNEIGTEGNRKGGRGRIFCRSFVSVSTVFEKEEDQ